MHYGIEVVPFGAHSNPRAVVEVAVAAEAAGWEALWIWDHVLFPWGAGDPWMILAAVASATKRIKLITGVSPMPRYQPHLLARTLAGLDLLSEGRVIFGAGLGPDFDFIPFGPAMDVKTRALMTDEGLDVLDRLLAGEKVTHHGAFYHVDGVAVIPTPQQRPRMPIWIGGDSPPALRRAAKWEGWIIGVIDEQCNITRPPERLAESVATIKTHRKLTTPFDVAVDGASQPGDRSMMREYEAAGATWWFEGIFGRRGSDEDLLRRIKAGP